MTDAPRFGIFVEEKYGARVATVRDGDNSVEVKDNRDGTCDLTVFWRDEERGCWEDLTAYRMQRHDLIALRRAIDAMLLDGTSNT